MDTPPPRRRAAARPALAALLACAALAVAPGPASAAPAINLTALNPATWLQPNGTFRIPLQLQLSDWVEIARIEITVDGVLVAQPAPPADPVSAVTGLAVTLPGTPGTRTIRVSTWVVEAPSYGSTGSPRLEQAVAETVVALASTGAPGAGGPGTGSPKAVAPGTKKVVVPRVSLLQVRTVRRARVAFVRSTAAARLELVASRRVGRKWRVVKRVRTTLAAARVRRVPLGRLAAGRYRIKAVVRHAGGRTGTRTVALTVRAAARR